MGIWRLKPTALKSLGEPTPLGRARPKALNGEIETLIGVNSAYVPPENPNLIVNTETLSPNQAADAIIDTFAEAGWPGWKKE